MAKNLKGLMRGAAEVVDWASHAHTAASLIGALRGKEMPTDAPRVSQGLAGFFGKGDERSLQLILAALTTPERTEISNFLGWHFQGDAWQDKLLVMWYQSAFRVFVTGIKSGGKGDEVTEEVVTKSGDTTTTTKTKKSAHDESFKDALAFLELIVSMIRSGRAAHKKSYPTATTQECTEAGYRKVIDYFRATGVPHMPPKSTKDWEEWAKALGIQGWKQVQSWYLTAREAVYDHYEKVVCTESREGNLKRWLRKHFT